jgi:tRNA uridine 5-carbamoylmethylation protein Kti12
MLLQEANDRLKAKITGEQLDVIHPLYAVLDFSKDDFCKMVDAIGIDKLLSRSCVIKLLEKATQLFYNSAPAEINEYKVCISNLLELGQVEQTAILTALSAKTVASKSNVLRQLARAKREFIEWESEVMNDFRKIKLDTL